MYENASPLGVCVPLHYVLPVGAGVQVLVGQKEIR